MQRWMQMMRGVIAIVEEQPITPGAHDIPAAEKRIIGAEPVMLQQVDRDHKPLPKEPRNGKDPKNLPPVEIQAGTDQDPDRRLFHHS